MIRKTRKSLTAVVIVLTAICSIFAATGCDENYVAAGDFMTPSVAPADFSPYGYDYDMYDLFTEDI